MAVSLAGAAERGARGAGPECGVGGSGQQEDKPGRLGRSPAGSAGTRRAGRVALTMVYCWDTGVLLCALLSGLLLTGQARPGSDGEARAHSGAGDTLRGEPRRDLGRESHRASLGSRRLFPSRGGRGARPGEQLEGPRASPPRMALRLALGGWSRRPSLPGSGLGERRSLGSARPSDLFPGGGSKGSSGVWRRGSRNAGEAARGLG